MIDQLRFQSAIDATRRFLVLADDEPVDRILLAAILCNFDPARHVPIWLIIVGSPSSGKTELASLIQDWKYTWPLPDPLTAGYFFSSRNKKESALFEIDSTGARILYIHDMISLLTLHPRDAGVYSQLIGIHDGFLHHATGYNAEKLTYGPKETKDRLGLIGTATEKFYAFQERWFQFGSRFISYYFQSAKREWDDHGHLTQISALSNVAQHRGHARAQVQSFLNHAIELIQAGEFESVKIDKKSDERLATAVTLVQRILGAGKSSDPGVRLHRRVQHITRMLAFIDGRDQVAPPDVAIGVKIILSQLPLEANRILTFSLIPENRQEPWFFRDLLAWAGGTRTEYSEMLETMADIRILRREGNLGNKGYKFMLSEKADALVRKFDPEGVLFVE